MSERGCYGNHRRIGAEPSPPGPPTPPPTPEKPTGLGKGLLYGAAGVVTVGALLWVRGAFKSVDSSIDELNKSRLARPERKAAR